MRTLNILFLLLLLLVGFGCNQDDDAPPYNQGPDGFTIEVTKVTGTIAQLAWTRATDPNGDSVMYTVFLRGQETNLETRDTIIVLQGLDPQTRYSGKIVASDGNEGVFESAFSFETEEIAISWQRSFGGSENDTAFDIEQTVEGGYIVAGISESSDGDVESNNGNTDSWIVKLDALGNLVWETNLGGSEFDGLYDVEQIQGGGYIGAGMSHSSDGDVEGNNGLADYWIVRLDASGSLVWETNLGGSSVETARDIEQTVDGGYIVAGGTRSSDGDIGGSNGLADYWIVKLDVDGNLLWETTLGGSNDDVAYAIEQTIEGGYVVAGISRSYDGDVESNNGGYDYWIVKLDASGSLLWETSLGGSQDEEASDIEQTTDGGYVVTGISRSSDGDVGNNNGTADYWIVKLDASGSLVWETNLGGSGIDIASDIEQTIEGGYIITGTSESSDGDILNNNGLIDYWIVKLNATGNLEWEINLGGSHYDTSFSIIQSIEGEYTVAGGSGPFHNRNYWIVNLR